jgi:hypothetical protein
MELEEIKREIEQLTNILSLILNHINRLNTFLLINIRG